MDDSEQLVDEDDEFMFTYWQLTMLEKPTAKPRKRFGSIVMIVGSTIACWKLGKRLHLEEMRGIGAFIL